MDTNVLEKKGSEYFNNQEIAIVGIGCRYPGGVHGAKSFWSFLKDGKEGVGEIPADRWSLNEHFDPRKDRAGKSYVSRAAFLNDWSPYDFDPTFFGISAREAESMDPQQRIALEMAFDAIEDAGLSPEQLADESTGVFLGCFTLDNTISQMSPYNRPLIDTHTATSSTMAILSNRISYVFGFEGPSLTIDTACSSSMVALHYALKSLQSGDCKAALVGGVNIMMRPEYFMIMGAGHYLAEDGRSKAFDALADGYGRGEGCGMLLLKPLREAIRAGDRVHAVIKGTGVNQDGRTNGISVPNGAAQKKLLNQLLEKNNVTPEEIVYVEAHGTGTPVGDPIECEAIGSVIGQQRANPCIVGSLKSSIGHQEAGAGIAGIIKAVLSLKHSTAAPQATLGKLNPAIPFESLGIKVVKEPTQLVSTNDSPMHAVINSFGYGGTNAMALIRELSDSEKMAESRVPVSHLPEKLVLPVSARDNKALRSRAKEMAMQLSGISDYQGLHNFFWTASQRRPHLSHRLVSTAESIPAMVESLENFANGISDPKLACGRVVASEFAAEAVKPIFVFSGMGPQYPQMGQALLQTDQAFRAAAEAADKVFRSLSGWSVLEEIQRPEASSKMSDTRIAQPANALIQIALTESLRERGVIPAAVVGHSVGEIGSGYASGLLTLEEAMTVAYHRSQLQARLAGKGTMLAVALAQADAKKMLDEIAPDVSIAAVNAANILTLAGKHNDLLRISERLETDGRFNRFLQVEIAYHSPQMDVIEEPLKKALADIGRGAVDIPLVSTVSGALVSDKGFDGDYWFRNVRQPVQFKKAMETLLTQGHRHFLEVGPHPVLSQAANACMNDLAISGIVFSTLNRKLNDLDAMDKMTGNLHVSGCGFDWQKFHSTGQQIDLPCYPFQRQRYWKESQSAQFDRIGSELPPLCGVPAAGSENTWQFDLGLNRIPWLFDHKVENATVFPGAAYVASALAVHSYQQSRNDYLVLDRLRFQKGLVISEEENRIIQLRLDKTEKRLSIHSRSDVDETSWLQHATVRLSSATVKPSAASVSVERLCKGRVFSAETIYESLQKRGLNYGSEFRRIEKAWVNESQVVSLLCRVEGSKEIIDPCLLDACFQSLIACEKTLSNDLYIPVGIRQIRIYQKANFSRFCIANITKHTADQIEGDLQLISENGEILAEVAGLVCQKIKAEDSSSASWENWLFGLESQEQALEQSTRVSKEKEEKTTAVIKVQTETNKALTNEEITDKKVAIKDVNATLPVSQISNQVTNQWLLLGDQKFSVSLHSYLKSNQIQVGRAQTNQLHLAQQQKDYDVLAYVPNLNDKDPSGINVVQELLEVIQKVSGLRKSIRLVVVNPPSKKKHALAFAALKGMIRVLSTEHPEMRPLMVDVSGLHEDAASKAVMQEALSTHEEREVIYEPEQRKVLRVCRKSFDPLEGSQIQVNKVGDKALELAFDSVGDLDSLVWSQVDVPSPGPGEVQLKAQAASVNFKDVLKVLGLLDKSAIDNTYHGQDLGMETAAEVIAVGEGVTQLKVGQQILVQPHGGFKTIFNEKIENVFWMPQIESLTAEQNASIIVVYLTAHYGLTGPGQLSSNERVLIHAAAGGVGQAAVKIAKAIGAEIYATAGTESKRQLLRTQGCKGVYDSRDLGFAEAIRRDTNGEGVDVVLNSLAGEAATLSFELLRPHGRFVEIGKRDFQTEGALPLAYFNRGLSYTALDLDRRMNERPDQYVSMLEKLWALLKDGTLIPDHPKVFPAAKAVDAFRHLSQSKNVGKVVLSFDPQAEITSRTKVTKLSDRLSTEGCYIITGGLSGLGLLTAKLLAEKGAGHLILCGRRGMDTPGVQQAFSSFDQLGVSFEVKAVDVADASSVQELVRSVHSVDRPIKGIVHAAGLLDDGLISGQTSERIQKVMEPKALGAWNLHNATTDINLDFFVIYSSVSAIVGNAGQCGYAAANCVADELARLRRESGQHGLSINWGPVAEVGMAARDPEVVNYFDSLGLYSMSPENFCEVLEAIFCSQESQIIVGDLDWQRWATAAPRKASEPFFENIRGNSHSSAVEQFRQKLTNLSESERLDEVLNMSLQLIGKTLKMSPEDIDVEVSLIDLGLDSLMTVELQTSIAAAFGVELSTMELMKGSGSLSLARDVLDKLE